MEITSCESLEVINKYLLGQDQKRKQYKLFYFESPQKEKELNDENNETWKPAVQFAMMIDETIKMEVTWTGYRVVNFNINGFLFATFHLASRGGYYAHFDERAFKAIVKKGDPDIAFGDWNMNRNSMIYMSVLQWLFRQALYTNN